MPDGDRPSWPAIILAGLYLFSFNFVAGFIMAAGPDATMQDIQDHIDPAGIGDGPPEFVQDYRPFNAMLVAIITLNMGTAASLWRKYRRTTL